MICPASISKDLARTQGTTCLDSVLPIDLETPKSVLIFPKNWNVANLVPIVILGIMTGYNKRTLAIFHKIFEQTHL